MYPSERTLILIFALLFAANAVKAEEYLVQKSPGQAPGRNLKIKKSKVPTFEIHQAKNELPRLQVGQEAEFQFQAPNTQAPASALTLPAPVQKKFILEALQFDAKKLSLPSASSASSLYSNQNLEKMVEVKTLADIENPVVTGTTPEVKKIKELTEAEKKLLEAQIVLEKHESPETALGLLAELLDNKEVQNNARFSYALAARQLKLNSEFRSLMFKIATDPKTEKEWGKIATEVLAQEVTALKFSDMKLLSSLVEKFDVETDKNAAYNFYLAKASLEAGKLGEVEQALALIPEKSVYAIDALMISALSAYRQGQIDKAAGTLTQLLSIASKDESLRSTAAITLARIYFQKSEYKKAYEAYLQVDKSNALWLQAMVESAWTQILNQDFEGAAGNMFSLHTDFFKNAFAPESYTARSVAYLNLCQFGDGKQALENFRKKYGPLVGRLGKYRSEKNSPQDDYETIRTWLKQPELKEVAGLPRSFVIELARHPSFMQTQTQINEFEDELENFTKATVALIQLEKELTKKQSELRDELQKMKSLKESGQGSNAELKIRAEGMERQIADLKLRAEFAKKARSHMKDARLRASARIDKEKESLKVVASQSLRKRLNDLTENLVHVLEQNEVLQYEIMAGAGEHIRTQSAGAEVDQKKREQLKPADGKSIKWSFQGEIWEDEVGHYRSSLKSVCTKEEKVAAY